MKQLCGYVASICKYPNRFVSFVGDENKRSMIVTSEPGPC